MDDAMTEKLKELFDILKQFLIKIKELCRNFIAL